MISSSLFLAAADAASTAAPHTPPPSSPLEPVVMFIASVGVAVLAVGIILCLYRMLRGPHLADRVLAADMLSIHVLALVVVLAIKFESGIFFDAALVVAILGFASTVAFSQYIYARRGLIGDAAEEVSPPPSEPASGSAPAPEPEASP